MIINKLNTKVNKFVLDKIGYIKENPHHTALGMAVGVFIAATPTIPFHTVLALMLASLIRGSKTAAMLGVWVSNPVTVPIIYIANYKIGMLILGKKDFFLEMGQMGNISDIFKVGIDIMLAMIAGGIILGIVPSLLTYLLTRWIVTYLNKKNNKII